MSKEIIEILAEMYDIQVRYTKPLLKENYTDKDYAIENYENIVFKMKNIITNLQEENERLKVDKETIQRWYNLCKSRNEKASKIIQDIFKDENWYKNYEYNDLEDTLKNVDDILNGGDDNE